MRSEYKYIVPNTKMDKLRKMIMPFVDIDKFAKDREGNHYTVKSIYFDSPNFLFYSEKNDHEKHRKKVRLRGYNSENSNNTVFLEIKRKYEAPIFKNRCPLKYEDSKKIFSGKSIENYVENNLKFPNAVDDAKRFFYQIYTKKLMPVVNVIYEREPFLGKLDNNIRITFDKNLRSSPYPTIDDLYNEKRIRYSLKGRFILEVKFNDYYPSWMKPIIGVLGLQKVPASKYTLCIDSQNMLNKISKPAAFTYVRLFNKKTELV